jgi:hypothetical protein
MTEDEIQLLTRELGQAHSYFEYGAGESTKLAVRQPNLEKVFSTESDKGFIQDRLLPDPVVAENVASGRLVFADIDIGPTGQWGRPTDVSSRDKWPSYADAIAATQAPWDLILVDGLFRVACVAAALLHSPEARVLVHDFWRRKRYRPVLDYCDELETANQLVLLQRKGDTTDEALQTLRQKHVYLPADKTAWLKFQAKLGIKI